MIAVLGLIAIVAILLGGSYYAYRIAFFSPTEGRDKIPTPTDKQYDPYRDVIDSMFQTLMARPCEEVTIRSHDGLTLFGRYYHTADGAPLDIGFHGYRSCYVADFCGGSDMSISLGHNLLLIDQRSHGRSEGKSITFGIQERLDCLSWVNYAIDRFGPEVKITLYGVSMGAATVLMASGLDLPANVKGIIADCPYSVAEDIIVDVGEKSMHLHPSFTVPFARLGALIYGGFNLNAANAIQAVQNTKVPILIIHGEADDFVPAEMSAQAQRANPNMVHRITFPGAGHAMSYLVDTPRYRQVVREFMEEILA